MFHKHNYLKSEHLTKQLIYPSVIQKTKNSRPPDIFATHSQARKNQYIYPSPAQEELVFLVVEENSINSNEDMLCLLCYSQFIFDHLYYRFQKYRKLLLYLLV